jgi:alpha-glucosidase
MPQEGSYAGQITRRKIKVELPGDWPPKKILVNGQDLPYTDADSATPGWRFEGNTLTTSIVTAEFATDSTTTIVVTRDADLAHKSELLDGFAGKMTSLRHAYDAVNGLWTVEPLVIAMQTGNRIGYQPQNAKGEVERLAQFIRSSQSTLAAIITAEQSGSSSAPSPQRTAEQLERERTRMERLARASAAVEEALKDDAAGQR